MTHDEEKRLFINREMSWLEFDLRVLELAKDRRVPLGEQLKFASIYVSNLDEFFMVRVGSLYDHTLLKSQEKENKTGMTAQQQLDTILPRVAEQQTIADKYTKRLFTALENENFHKVDFEKLEKKEEQDWKKYFIEELLPILSPQIVDDAHPFPFLHNLCTYVGAILKGKDGRFSFGIVPIYDQFQRIIYFPKDEGLEFALVEELVLHFADLVFGKNESLKEKCLFRITRNADLDVLEAMFDEDLDYRDVMSELLKKRRKLAAVRLQLKGEGCKEIKKLLCVKLPLSPEHCFEQTSPLDMSFCFKLSGKLLNEEHQDELFYPSRRPTLPPRGFSLEKAAQKEDVLLFYPYQSIKPFIEMLQEAAKDPFVTSIKMTLYRVADDSKIVEALVNAAENGKEVIAVVELRARFDEQNNIDWSRELERAGCHVIYGLPDFKVHSKLTLITREKDGKKTYTAQIGTGNYNEKTAELYTDLTVTTTDQEIGSEVDMVFRDLALGQNTPEAKKLLVAPLCFKSVLLKEMDQEIAAQKAGEQGYILLKCNAISDREIIEKLAEASRAGVKVDMVVRGICCLRAGIKGLSEHIRVRSIVGRYLEHARIYGFGSEQRKKRVYIASGDFLTRNTERRVEVGVCVQNEALQERLWNIVQSQLHDNVNAREMQPDGSYTRVRPAPGEELLDSQAAMYDYLQNAWPVSETENPDKKQKKNNFWNKLKHFWTKKQR